MDIVDIEIPNLIKDEFGKVHNVEFELTREAFEAAIEPLIDQTIETMKTALENAKLTERDISRVILVGGSSRIPLVSTKIKELLNKEPYANIDRILLLPKVQPFSAQASVYQQTKLKKQVNWMKKTN